MRIKNKEIRRRRHRKEQAIKAAVREAKGASVKQPKSAVAAKPAPKKTAAKKAAPAKKAAAKKKEGTEE
jgi:hypothetical protein